MIGPAKRGTRRARSQEGDAPVSLPPPVTDTNSWPTPDLAQGEFKKEKDNKEKDKTVPLAGRGSSKTWVPVAIDPPYAPPIQSKAGRGGRGGRGGRESGRGGATGAPHGGERQERVAGQNALGTPEGDRGRQYSNPRGGGYKAPKRSSSGGAGTRRETKNGSGERKKDVGEWNSESSAPLASAQARPAKSGEDGASIGDAHHYPEGEEKVMNGNGYRPEKSSNWVPRNEADSSGAYNPRGSDRGRGGYRGRGNYGNGHHIPGHPNNMPYPQGVNNHPFNHHTQLRGGSFRGRGGGYGYNQHYRVNPNMIPQFTHPIYAPGYEYSMIPGGAQPVDFGALIHQM